MKMTMKQRVGNKWETVDLSPMVDITLECLLLNFWEHPRIKEAVAEFVTKRGKVYLCSTQEWVDYFTSRGDKAFTIPVGVDALRVADPAMLDGKIPPLVKDAIRIFGGQITEVGE